MKDLNFSFTDFKDKKGNSLSDEAFKAGFIRYVMTDELNKDGRGACGHRQAVDYDSLLVADPIDTNLKSMSVPARTVQLSGCNVGFLNRLLPEPTRVLCW